MMDNLDLKILQELEINSRQTSVTLAEKLSSSRKKIMHRIRQMEKKQLIRSYTILVDYHKLGFIYYMKFWIKVSPDKLASVLNKVKKLAQIHWIQVITGEFDLHLVGMFRTHDELYKFLEHELGRIPGITSIHSEFYFNSYLRSYPIQEAPPEKNQFQLTKLDYDIIEMLRDNGRISYSDLATQLNTNLHLVIYRVKRLIDHGIIKQFTIITNPWKLGYTILAIIRVQIIPKLQKSIIQQLLEYNEVNWISELSSEDSLDVNAQFFNRLHFREFIQKQIITLSGVISTKSHLILNAFGKRY